jgi:glycine oxidase
VEVVARSADVIVVGAGIIGCAVAAECARRGAAVTLIEVRGVGRGATQASAGLLAPYVEAPDEGPLRTLGARSLALYDEFVARAIEESGVPVEYRRPGTLEVATDEAALAALQAAAARHSTEGIPCELVDGAGARALEPELASDVLGGLLIPVHGLVAAGPLTAALAEAARRRAAQVIAPRAVHRIAAAHQGLRVEFDGEVAIAPTVVFAAGAWSSTIVIEGASPLPVRPVRGQILELGWCGTPLGRPIWGPDCYLVPWHDGRLLVGATMEEAGFDERTTVAGVFDLLEGACALAPRCWQATFREARVGFRPATPDGLPILGASQRLRGLIYATGHFRNGVLLAPLTAELVATLALDGRADPLLATLSPARFGDF